MAKSKRSQLIDKLDDVVSKIVRARDKVCVLCGRKDKLTCGHIFGRGHHSLRWDIRPDGNCHTQCWPCNRRHVFDTYPYYDWHMRKFGKDRFDELYQEWQATRQFKIWELKELYEQLIKANRHLRDKREG
mgnify:CR=1 FL=1